MLLFGYEFDGALIPTFLKCFRYYTYGYKYFLKYYNNTGTYRYTCDVKKNRTLS